MAMSTIKRTKIIATVGPVTWAEEQIIALYKAGVNVLRFNFSHADYDNTAKVAAMVHKLNKEGTTKLGLLLDTKGPEIRTGDYEGLKSYIKGDIFNFYVDMSKATGEKDLACDYPYLVEDLEVGHVIKIESGLFDVVVKEKAGDHLVVEALHSITIKQRRHVNLPGVKLRLPGLIPQDKKDTLFAIEHGFDYIAMSFVRNKSNIQELRDLLAANNASHIQIISKIENQEALDNLEEIVLNSDGVMVARGDLGIEIAIETLPVYQRNIVKLCRANGKYVIVATHMLESMIENPFPTRAEVSDIFNAVVQKADAIMLSGETTIGKYPIQAVDMMKKVALQAEAVLEYKHEDYTGVGLTARDEEKKTLLKGAVQMAEQLGAKGIVVFTKTGRLARLAAAYRPTVPVFAFTNQERTLTNTTVLFGIIARYLPFTHHAEVLKEAIQKLVSTGNIANGDKVVVVSDILRDGKEFPILEVVAVSDVL